MHGTAEGDGVSEISDFEMRNSERGLSNCVIGMWNVDFWKISKKGS